MVREWMIEESLSMQTKRLHGWALDTLLHSQYLLGRCSVDYDMGKILQAGQHRGHQFVDP